MYEELCSCQAARSPLLPAKALPELRAGWARKLPGTSRGQHALVSRPSSPSSLPEGRTGSGWMGPKLSPDGSRKTARRSRLRESKACKNSGKQTHGWENNRPYPSGSPQGWPGLASLPASVSPATLAHCTAARSQATKLAPPPRGLTLVTAPSALAWPPASCRVGPCFSDPHLFREAFPGPPIWGVPTPTILPRYSHHPDFLCSTGRFLNWSWPPGIAVSGVAGQSPHSESAGLCWHPAWAGPLPSSSLGFLLCKRDSVRCKLLSYGCCVDYWVTVCKALRTVPGTW